MVIVEKSFPRGGIAEAVQKKELNAGTTEHIVFGAVQKKIKKSSGKVNVTSNENGGEHLEASSAELLNYNTIQEGMNVMGIIKKIDELYLSVDLPGRIVAKVSALDISEAYTQAVETFVKVNDQTDGYSALSAIFKIGQIAYGRVKELKRNEKGHTLVDLSLKPSCVHSELQHQSIRKGFLFAGSIEAIEDHGYIIESGIKHIRCFLPYDKSEKGFVIGQSIYLKVTKITHDKSVSTCICKQVAANELIAKNQTDINLDYLLPSIIVKFRINKILSNGVQGTIMDETFTAYANEHHLGNPFTLPKDLDINATYNARILYVLPLTKFVFVTLNIQNNSSDENVSGINDEVEQKLLKRGEIVENAKVHHIGTGGVVLILNDEVKGILSYKTIKMNYKGNYDQDVLMTKYSKNSLHKVRILDYDIMDSLYICTDDTKIVNEKYLSVNDMKSGDYVTAVVQQSNEKIGGYTVQIGKVRGQIEKLYSAAPGKHLEVGTKIKCRVMYTNIKHGVVHLTNRPEYLDKNCKLLKSFEEAHVDAKYMGTVVDSTKSNKILVKFFGNTKGILYKNSKQGNTIDAVSLMEGQTMLFRIASKKHDNLILSLLENNFKYGEICTVKIVQNLESGLEVEAVHQSNNGKESTVKGFIPIRLLSDFENLLLAKLGMFENGDIVKAVSISNNILSLRDVTHFSSNAMLKWQQVKCGDILKAYVHNVTANGDIVELMVAISNFKKPIKVHAKMLLMNAVNLGNISLSAEQVLYVKVLGKESVTRMISVTGKLMDVWQGKLDVTAQYVESYLNEVKEIKEAYKRKGCSISNFSVGQKIKARFQYVDESTNDWIYAFEGTEIIGVIKSHQVKRVNLPKADENQKCIILWIDYSDSIVYLSNKPTDIDHICQGEKLPKKLFGKLPFYHEAKVLYKNPVIMVCSLKKQNNPIIYCPVRLHFNDLEKIGGATIMEGDFCKLAFIHRTLPIAVLEHIYKLYKETNKRKTEVKSELDENALKAKRPRLKGKQKASVKQAIEQECLDEASMVECEIENEIEKNDVKMKKSKLMSKKKQSNIKQQNKKTSLYEMNTNVNSTFEDTNGEMKCDDSSNKLSFYEDKICSKKAEETKEAHQIYKTQQTKVKIKDMPNVSGFWDLSIINNDEATSSDDELENSIHDNVEVKTKDKKKLTASEKFKLEREEEARLRAIEEKYSDPKQLPETIDQFDRLVLSEPDNSKCWINYMVFHLQSSEIEKARSVARRALKTITYTNVQDRLNIWVALLNLELRYGNKEAFNDTLKEALMCNDQKSIYLRTLDILTDAQKSGELQELVQIVIRKFGKCDVDIWKSAANALFTIGRAEKAQQLLHKSLISLPEREHISAIVTFANLNYKHGFKELAQTLLDQVVSSYPKRVDVWSQYVDMLIKEELIDSARNVLERAISQIIPLRKMRTIFKKYLEFEERYGDDAKVQRVKQLALDFVNKSQHL